MGSFSEQSDGGVEKGTVAMWLVAALAPASLPPLSPDGSVLLKATSKGRGEAVRTEKGWLLFNSDEEFEMWRQNVMIKPDSGKSVVIKKNNLSIIIIQKANKVLPDDEKIPHWTPYQLRHAAGTATEDEAGLDEA